MLGAVYAFDEITSTRHGAPPAPASYDNSAVVKAGQTNAIDTPYACGADANILLVATAAGLYDGGLASTFTRLVTYDGVPMTSLGAVDSGGQPHGFIELWYLWYPSVGVPKTLHVSVSKAGVTLFDLIVGAVSYNDVSGISTAVTGSGDTTPPAFLSIPSDTGHISVAAFTSSWALANPTDRQRVFDVEWANANGADTLLIEDQDGAATSSLGADVTGIWAGLAVDLVGGTAPSPPPAAAVFSAAGTGASETPSDGTVSQQYTIPAGSNLLLVGVGVGGNYGNSYSTFTRAATFDGVALTSLGAVDGAGVGNGFVELWAMLNPPVTGVAKTLTVSVTGHTVDCVIVEPLSYANVLSLGTPVLAQGTGAPSVTVPSNPGHVVVAVMGSGAAISGATDTVRYANNVSNAWGIGNLLMQDQDGETSAVLGFANNSDSYAVVAVNLVGGSAPPPPPPSGLPTITSIVPNPAPAGPVTIYGTNFVYSPPPPTSVTITSISPNPGPAGSVTIYGTGFQPGSTVSFGGVPATNVTVLSSTQIACTAPAHADGQVQVTVTTPSAGSATAAFTYQAAAPGSPTAWVPGGAWMNPFYGVTGTGTKTVPTAGAFDGSVSNYSLQGSPPGGVSINSGTGVVSISTTSPIPWTTLTIRASNASGWAETTLDVWVFTPTSTIAAGTDFPSSSPAPGSIICIRGGTYTTSQHIEGWAGAQGNPIIVVAYPGEDVVWNANGLGGQEMGYPACIHINNSHDVEVRGFTFFNTKYQGEGRPRDDSTICYFAIHSGTGCSRIKIAQNEVYGFNEYSMHLICAAPYYVEYNHFHDNVQQNNPADPNIAGWGQGIRIEHGEGSIIRRNHIHENYGEGLGWGTGEHYGSFQILQNLVHDNWSKNIYGGASDTDIHGNICWNDPVMAFMWFQPGSASIEIADEGSGMFPSNNIVTNNYYVPPCPAPAYGYWSSSEGSGNVWTPNYALPAVDQRWKTLGGPIPW